ncbi:MAG: CYTH and CHAD domain-containing protein, partial [Actinobacteria bacterium]|nr:CYTH and CHAD domain-containing protein [Actinomycetota bacterium]
MAEIKETLERELKLRAGPEFELPELGGEAIEPRVFDSTYHDTRDHRLARHGVTLRYRIENRKGVWQLKLPQGDARLELEAKGTPATPPNEILSLLPAYLRGEPLLPLARLRTKRTGIRAQGAEIVYDEVTVVDQRKIPRSFEELEIELLEGDEKALRRIEKALRRAGAADGETRPKVFQALDLTFEPEAAEPAGDGSGGATLAAELRRQYERLLAHDPGTRLGTDLEELHQFRVATRRLRAFLRAGRELLDSAWAEPLREELRWLGGELGPSRDLDVLIHRLQAEVEKLGDDAPAGRALVEVLERDREALKEQVTDALSSDRYFAILDLLEQPPPLLDSDLTLKQIQAAEHRKLTKAIDDLSPDSPDGQLHEARIKVKRARYAAELRGDDGYVKAAKRLQDVL